MLRALVGTVLSNNHSFVLRNIEKSVATLPINFCKFKILPELIQSLEFGGAGSKALKPILTIGGRLGAKEFEQLVTPAIIKLFNSSDRSIRLALCEKIDSYVHQLSDQACNDTIYPNLVLLSFSVLTSNLTIIMKGYWVCRRNSYN